MKLIIYGIAGTMGRKVLEAAKLRNYDVVGVDAYAKPSEFDVPVVSSLEGLEGSYDALVDFSHKSQLSAILDYVTKTKTPAVLCTTGYDEKDKDAIYKASKRVPLFQSGNMSLGVNVLEKLVKEAARLLNGKADVEIIEQHHNQKADAPSGTALMLANAVKSEQSEREFLFGREGMVGKRTKNELGIHAVRGGTVVGKHEVVFLMNNQVITLKHEAESKGVFAEGSLDAAEWLVGKAPGLYSMHDITK